MQIRRFVWILSVLIVVPLNAQQKKGLYIDSYSGAAQVKAVGAASWSQPARKQSVTRLDSVLVPEQAKMDIINAVNGDIYPCDFAFKGTINQCLQQAKEKQSGVFRALAKQMTANMFGKTKNTPHHVYGGATRTEDEDRYNDSIACLALATSRAKRTPYPYLTLHTLSENGTVRFIIDNTDKKAYYVNVLMLNTRTGAAGLRIVPEPDMVPEALLLPAGQTLDLSMFRFLDIPDMRYVLFAAESPFVPAAIHPLLRYPEDINCP